MSGQDMVRIEFVGVKIEIDDEFVLSFNNDEQTRHYAGFTLNVIPFPMNIVSTSMIVHDKYDKRISINFSKYFQLKSEKI
jgi:hypothetical protein